jgi:6,7-dimethyl-8-ribityllumazine synthase
MDVKHQTFNQTTYGGTMPKIVQGSLIAKGLRFGIVVSRYNSFITDRLLEGALDALTRNGAVEQDIEVWKVPGSFEIPFAAKRMVESSKHDAIICLGTIIRGATQHYNYIATEVTKGIATVSLQSGTPISFGVITADTLEQAVERAGSRMGNKGYEAAVSAIEMVNLFKAS